MKYESSILKRLIDTYGVIGNPRYLSEIINEFIVRGKELYPQLFTYQSDWLAHIDEFGLTPEYTVSYTGQHIYAPNTKEKPVKRAILKGSTKYRDIDTGEFLETFEEDRNLELVSVKMPVLTTVGKNLCDNKFIVANRGRVNERNGLIYNEARLKPSVYVSDYINVKGLGYITFNRLFGLNQDGTDNVQSYAFYDKDKIYLTGGYHPTNPAVPENAHFFRITVDSEQDFQLEQGTQATPYEPFKSNILTVNEDIELRGIGEVQDTLDCLTGEVAERVGEIVLDGSESWNEYASQELTNTRLFYCGVPTNSNINASKYTIINNRFASLNPNSGGLWNTDVVGLGHGVVNNAFRLRVLKSTANTINELKEYLNSNPIVVQYELAEKSIKTVGLTIHDKDQQKVERLTSFEGGTHFTTSSQDGSLLPTLTVDVVTDLEETLAVCSLEGNTM